MKKKVVGAEKTQKKAQKNAPQKYASTERDQFVVVLEHIHADFKMFGESLQTTREVLEGRFDRVEVRLDRVETRLDKIEVRLDRVETRLDSIEARLAEHDTRLAQLELAINELVKELRDDTKQRQIDALTIRVATLETLLLKK